MKRNICTLLGSKGCWPNENLAREMRVESKNFESPFSKLLQIYIYEIKDYVQENYLSPRAVNKHIMVFGTKTK
jgi:hypothetical protein